MVRALEGGLDGEGERVEEFRGEDERSERWDDT